MRYSEITIRFCGIAGDGVVSSGKIFAGACAKIGLHVMVNDIYSAEIRGLGKSSSTIRFSTSKLNSMGDGIDLLVGMAAKESIVDLHDIKQEGSVMYDTSTPGSVVEEDSLVAHITPEIHGYGIPIKQLANEASGTNQGKNLVAIGAICYFYSLPPDMFIEQIKAIFARKGERIVETNITAFRLGYDYFKEHYPLNNQFEISKGLKPKTLISGNEAIAQGAIDCGLKFFAGYPITPATKIMEIAAKELPKLEGWTLQMEDEIAAISAVLGAWFAGKRAMTATAGPGLSLMSEMINMSVMAEIPAIIVNVQRGGPSTGLPTKVEQGDLNIALYGGSGDSPRVVMAPCDSEECYNGIQLAFDIAEKYQTPVIFLSDLFLGQRIETVAIEPNIDRERCTRKRPTPEQLKNYLRYQITDDGVSPLIVPGESGAIYSITGLEHSVTGNPNYESDVHSMMTAKRFRKFESMVADLPQADIIGDEKAVIGLAGWGSTIGSILEGMEIARKRGVTSKLIKSIMIHPQREDLFQEFFASCKKIIVPEMNYQGQYADLLKSRYGIRPIEVHIPSVNPVSPLKIAQKIMEANDELSQ
ncbi:MAG: 2-oxoacid:acceptor oxidoreductase subunit alpha [Candidatus Scalindua sp. AMX11]|nr:MAG: 2-oxoacid:acceptor oxidoreductase subunit alpha [Candidatus Scalindua sp.]NOG84634.1 2-oxoacid:acceptor oxidoreductase subunit alpha [Planctomycetota bacterium]RZV92407.1 MAG: 2-oxoacid:acceptor oxidoreductase subunit alpha [Candidatus Scalindua sp. SCAELEC01]TDE66067.1 MAG: 2-oxoacid:acceptor oxidoreductase subunit alpha [Candidatus Scalindua sp. AMX11]GJQ59039.1 MAG: pyruvate ferredoxin oxidoreductase [Candidatus Scalindua sp.]